MGKIEVCYSSSGQRYHKVIKYGDYLQSKCNLISNIGQQYYYEFTVIEFNKEALEDLELWPCQHCFGKKFHFTE